MWVLGGQFKKVANWPAKQKEYINRVQSIFQYNIICTIAHCI